jgi:hypothetical protein
VSHEPGPSFRARLSPALVNTPGSIISASHGQNIKNEKSLSNAPHVPIEATDYYKPGQGHEDIRDVKSPFEKEWASVAFADRTHLGNTRIDPDLLPEVPEVTRL